MTDILRVAMTIHAQKAIAKVSDCRLRRGIERKINKLGRCSSVAPLGVRLKTKPDHFRAKIGRYRVVYRFLDELIEVVHIGIREKGHRGDVYETFNRLYA